MQKLHKVPRTWVRGNQCITECIFNVFSNSRIQVMIKDYPLWSSSGVLQLSFPWLKLPLLPICSQLNQFHYSLNYTNSYFWGGCWENIHEDGHSWGYKSPGAITWKVNILALVKLDNYPTNVSDTDSKCYYPWDKEQNVAGSLGRSISTDVMP